MRIIAVTFMITIAGLLVSCGESDQPEITSYRIVRMGDTAYRIPHLQRDHSGRDWTKDDRISTLVLIDWPEYRARSISERGRDLYRYELNELRLRIGNSRFASLSLDMERTLSHYNLWDTRAGPFGLIEMVPKSEPTEKFFVRNNKGEPSNYEYYKALSFGRVSDLIVCQRSNLIPVATFRWCSHDFDMRGYTWSIQYDYNHLENWGWLKAQAINEFDSWKVEDPETAAQDVTSSN